MHKRQTDTRGRDPLRQDSQGLDQLCHPWVKSMTNVDDDHELFINIWFILARPHLQEMD